MCPELFVLAKPIAYVTQRYCVELAEPYCTASVRADQTGLAEKAKVLRDRRAAGPEVSSELADGEPATT